MKNLLLLLFLICLSCSNVDSAKDQLIIDSLRHELYDAQEIIASQERKIKMTEIQIEHTRQMVDSLNREIKIQNSTKNYSQGEPAILSMYQMHQDEFAEWYKQVSWLGLFKRGDRYYVEPAEVEFIKVHDIIVDEEDEKSGVKPIVKNNKDSVLFLLSARSIKPQNHVQHAGIVLEKVIPDDVALEIDFLGAKYKLFIKKDSVERDNRIIFPRHLYLINKETKQLIISHDYMGDQKFSVLWSGDLNGDKKLDLILDISNHYNVFKPALYLSFPEDEDELVKLVASQSLVGC